MNRTAYITHSDYRLHTLDGHPEHAGRIKRIWQVFDEECIIDKLHSVTPEPASREDLELVHTPRLIDFVHQTAKRGGGWIDPDTYATSVSYDVGLLSAGGAVDAVKAILDGSVQNALAVIRPPGHHATPDRSMGFCLFNNAAVAARYAQKYYDDINRVRKTPPK